MRRPRPLSAWLVPVAVALGAIAAALTRQATAVTHEVLPAYGQIPDFRLTDQQGRSISRQTLAGRVWVADFIFTRCAGQCPMMTTQMARLGRTLDGSTPVTLVSISVDPAWDTPEVLARHAAQVGTAKIPWVFLTGEPEQIARLCRDGFKLAFGEADGTAEEPITHSTRLVLVDRRGKVRGYYDAADAQAMSRLQRDVRVLLKERS